MYMPSLLEWSDDSDVVNMMSVTCLLEDIGVSMYLLWDITKGNSLMILYIWSPTVICIISKFSYLTQLTLIPGEGGGEGKFFFNKFKIKQNSKISLIIGVLFLLRFILFTPLNGRFICNLHNHLSTSRSRK